MMIQSGVTQLCEIISEAEILNDKKLKKMLYRHWNPINN